jgi:hypothetical protein
MMAQSMRGPLRLAVITVAGAVLLAVTAVHYIGVPYSPPPLAGPAEPTPVAVAHDGPAVIAELESRPLRLPVSGVQPEFRCPAAPAARGPVSLRTPARSPAGVSVLLFDVADWYAGALVVRGERLDGGAQMTFQAPDGLDYRPQALLHVAIHRGDAEETLAASSGPGCWAIVVDGYRLNEVFLANLR